MEISTFRPESTTFPRIKNADENNKHYSFLLDPIKHQSGRREATVTDSGMCGMFVILAMLYFLWCDSSFCATGPFSASAVATAAVNAARSAAS